MIVRSYRPADAQALCRLFFETVHTVCARDYPPAQLDAWAPKSPELAAWKDTFSTGTTLVAEENGAILGFGTVHQDGYLDLLYVHRDWQRRGVASVLCDFLEGLYPAKRMTVHASITARPFFENRDYRLVRPQQVVRRGQTLTNFIMEKELF